ncbi:MAG: hypothetical protein ACLQBX_07235 [Candidatus Limnocylindrales bacterium]|jgi:hypothetical protein
MAVVVINRIRLRIPVDEVAPSVARAFPAAFHSLPGFQRFYFLKVAETEAIALIVWATAEQAQTGAESLGPTLFAQILGPHLETQDRVVGEIVAEASAQPPLGGLRH